MEERETSGRTRTDRSGPGSQCEGVDARRSPSGERGPATVYERVGWEYLVIEGTDVGVRMTICGVACAGDVHLRECGDHLELVGCWSPRLTSFDIVADLPSRDAAVVGERGVAEACEVSQDDLPLVFTDDLAHPGLPGTFLHRRADRWVLVGDPDEAAAAS